MPEGKLVLRWPATTEKKKKNPIDSRLHNQQPDTDSSFYNDSLLGSEQKCHLKFYDTLGK